jgi:DHA1 family tetracycline resistance protein-like MFS transporter
LGGWIAGFAHNPAAPFWAAGALGVLNVIFISLFLPETNKNRSAAHSFHILKGVRNIRSAFEDKDARPVYMANFLYMGGFAFFTSFSGVLLVARYHLDVAGIGTFFGVVGLCMVITQLFVLRLVTKHYKERAIIRFTVPIMAGSMALFPFLPSLALAYSLMPVIAVAQGLTMANMTALVSKSVSPEKQGAALGINGSLLAFSQGTIPLLAGFSSGLIGVTAPFIAATIFILSSWWVLFGLKR